MKTFNDFLSESKVNIDGLRFEVSVQSDNKGTFIQFLPYSASADKMSANGMVEMITERFKKTMPLFAEAIYFEANGNVAAGLNFRIDKSELASIIAKSFK